ncbi:M1 family aminopeptidase, partial [Gemmatimonadota bacterium]
WEMLGRRILLLAILLLSFQISLLSADNSVTPPDTTDKLRHFLEQEHRFNLLRRRAVRPRLAAAAAGIELKHTIVQARLYMKENGEIEARAGLCLEYLDPDPGDLNLTLGGLGMQVHSVLRANGDSLEYSYAREEILLTINLPASGAGEDTLWVTYSGELYLAEDSDTANQTIPEQYEVPFQEITADYAYAIWGFWFPDLFWEDYEFHTLEINLTVPQGFVAVAAGDSAGVAVNGDSTATYSFSSELYGPSYNAATFSVARYTGYGMQIGGVKAAVYTLIQGGYRQRIDDIFQNVGTIFEYYEDLYGGFSYPWNELKIVEIGRGYFPLALADLEIILLPRGFFSDYLDSLDSDEIALLAHEIAHQWWGMVVTPDPSQSMWLAEGLAEFSSKYLIEKYIGEQGMDASSPWENKQWLALNLKYALALQMPLEDPDAEYPVVYEKGAWVVRMLLHLAGEESFKTISGSFLERYRGKFVTLEEFSEYWQSQAVGTDLSGFFSQWFYKTGTPEYLTRGCRVPHQETEYAWQVTVSQQSEWDMPVDIALYYPDGNVDISTQRIDRVLNEFIFASNSGLPDSVRLDPENMFLFYNRYVSNIILRVKNNTMNVSEPPWVAVRVDSLFPQDNILLNWRVGEGGFSQLEYDFSSGLTDTLYLPAQNATARIDYYLEVNDLYGQAHYYPPGAPDSLYSYYCTEYDDFPEEPAWISVHEIPDLGLSIYDLERGMSLHTYPDVGGCINISPNNKYLVSDDFMQNELVIIERCDGQIISRIPYNSDPLFMPQRLIITNDGKNIFMSASTGFPLHATLETYHVSVENKTFSEIDVGYYNSFDYNPLNDKIYLYGVSYYEPVDIYNIERGVVEDSIVSERIINFNHSRFSLSGDYREYNELIWGGYSVRGKYNTRIILRKTNLLTRQVFETLTIELPELGDELRSKTISALLLPDSKKAAFVFREESGLELNFWDFAVPGWHENIVLEGFDNGTFAVEMTTSASGRKLLVFRWDKVGPFLAVVDLENYRVERYLHNTDYLQFGFRFDTENATYSALAERGDANLDHRINVFDLIVLMGNLSGNNPNPNFESDVYADGKLNIFDLLEMLQLLSN